MEGNEAETAAEAEADEGQAREGELARARE